MQQRDEESQSLPRADADAIGAGNRRQDTSRDSQENTAAVLACFWADVDPEK